MSTELTGPAATIARLLEDGLFTAHPSDDKDDRRLTASVQMAAAGLLVLAQVRPNSVIDITSRTSLVRSSLRKTYHKFVTFNPLSECNCRAEAGAIFDPFGSLGLKAVILEAGYDGEGLSAELSLVLPAWRTADDQTEAGAFTIFTVDIHAFVTADLHTPFMRIGGVEASFPKTDAFLEHLLGMTPLGKAVDSYRSNRSTVEKTLGFPGAERYLVEVLPSLGIYFTSLASLLDSSHSH